MIPYSNEIYKFLDLPIRFRVINPASWCWIALIGNATSYSHNNMHYHHHVPTNAIYQFTDWHDCLYWIFINRVLNSCIFESDVSINLWKRHTPILWTNQEYEYCVGFRFFLEAFMNVYTCYIFSNMFSHQVQVNGKMKLNIVNVQHIQYGTNIWIREGILLGEVSN